MSSMVVKATTPQPVRHASASHEQPGYRICTRCVMDTSDPEIRFFADGTCNHCASYADRAKRDLLPPDQAAARLEQLVHTIRGAGQKDYDCMIGVSGGVDSTFVAYKVKQLGLRPLAVHLDNGWNSELAVDNIQRTLRTLDIDLLTHVVDWEEFRDLQLSFLKASVPDCEIPTDHAIFALLMNKAAELGIRYIITGSNVTSEAIMPPRWSYYQHDLWHLRAIHRQFGTKKLATLPQLGAVRFVYDVLIKRIKYLPILNLIDYQKDAAKELIAEKLGWRDYGGKHFESIYTRFFQGYILPTKFGFDKRRAHLSTLICSKGIDRQDALEELSRAPYDGYDLDGEIEYVTKKLGLTRAQFDQIMQAAPRKHSDYPTNQLLFERLSALRQFIKSRATSYK